MVNKDVEELIEAEQENKKQTPFFNFADSSLKRIDAVLFQMGMISTTIELSNLAKQQKKISLLKTLLQFSIPLSPESFSKEFKEEILNLNIRKVATIISRSQGYDYSYSQELDKRIDELVIEISLKLQEKGYFMPSHEESSLF